MQNATVIEETGVISCGWYATRKWLAGAGWVLTCLGSEIVAIGLVEPARNQGEKIANTDFHVPFYRGCHVDLGWWKIARRLEPRNHSPFLCSTRGFPEGANICADSIRFHRCNFSGATYLKPSGQYTKHRIKLGCGGRAARFSNSLLTFPCPAQGAGHGCKVMLITTVFWLSSYMHVLFLVCLSEMQPRHWICSFAKSAGNL